MSTGLSTKGVYGFFNRQNPANPVKSWICSFSAKQPSSGSAMRKTVFVNYLDR